MQTTPQSPPREGFALTHESTEANMADTKVIPPADATKAKTVEMYDMKAVHGLLIHPYTLTNFVTEKPTPHVKDAWCVVQIEAGKLEIV